MDILYINNYRGFKNTTINFKKVNFFVGENSTGKSSILDLINLINHPVFILNYNINNSSIQLGTFKDLAIKGSDSFDIGFNFGPKNDKNYYRLLTYTNNEGEPYLSKMTYLQDDFLFKSLRKNEILFYKYELLSTNQKKQLTFDDILEYHNREDNDWIEITDDEKTKNTVLISNLMHYVIKNMNLHIRTNNFVSSIIPTYIGPIRAKPKEIYFAYQLLSTFDGEQSYRKLYSLYTKTKGSKNIYSSIEKILNSYGKDSGLFSKIKIKKIEKEKGSPFWINVVQKNNSYKISNVGYGVSQILPILIDHILDRSEYFLIQQPEIHLHPKAQATYGELLFSLSVAQDNYYFIETHSDFLIDRFRYTISKNKKYSISSQVLFFERDSKCNKVSSIEILKDGKYSDNQPVNFRDFFFDEYRKLLSL